MMVTVLVREWASALPRRLGPRGLRALVGGLRRWAGDRRAPPRPPSRPWLSSYPPDVRWDAAIEVKPVASLLADAAAGYGNKTCLRFCGRRYGFAELDATVSRVARGLVDCGVGKDVLVGLFLPNSPYFVIAYHAVLRAGGTVVSLPQLAAAKEVEHIVADSGLRIAVTADMEGFYPKLAALAARGSLDILVVCRMARALPWRYRVSRLLTRRGRTLSTPVDRRYLRFEALAQLPPLDAPAPVDPETDIAVLQYTGALWGPPIAATLTHANVYANVRQNVLWATAVRPGEERVLGVLPLAHMFGMTTVLNYGLAVGAEVMLLAQFQPKATLAAIDRWRPTVLIGVPAIYAALADHAELGGFDLSSLRYCVSGGAPLSDEVRDTFEARTGLELVEGYGLTEAAPCCTLNPFSSANRRRSVGLPLPGTSVRIVGLDGGGDVPIGEVGEVYVAGPQVMCGYWRRPEQTRAALKDGWLRTGDMGFLDPDGYLYLTGRAKPLIITGGFNVYPPVVEAEIRSHPHVADTHVFGVPDRRRGELVQARVQARPNCEVTARELRAFLRERLAPYEIPRRFDFVDAATPAQAAEVRLSA